MLKQSFEGIVSILGNMEKLPITFERKGNRWITPYIGDGGVFGTTVDVMLYQTALEGIDGAA